MREFEYQEGEFSAPKELMDKATWHEQVDIEILYAKENSTPLSVIFVDINAFKSINDELGHVAGDDVIEAIGSLVAFVGQELRTDDNNYTRRADIVTYGQTQTIESSASRVGGDEFAILAAVDEEGANGLMLRLRGIFSDYIEHPDNKIIKELGVGLAIGVATLEQNMTSRELLVAADNAMYEDKLNQLPELNDEQETFIKETLSNLRARGIRPRDLENHLRKQRRNS